MLHIDWNECIQKVKREYINIGSIPCPAFGGKLIHFDERGFNHLVMKQGVRRTRSEQLRKFKLLAYAPYIVRESDKFSTAYKNNRGKTCAYFWSLKSMRKDTIIIVIIRQIGDTGDKHFLSIMSKRLPKSAQTP